MCTTYIRFGVPFSARSRRARRSFSPQLPLGPSLSGYSRRSCRVCPSAIRPRGFNTVTAAVTTSSLMGGET
jgi:hypothetical protein